MISDYFTIAWKNLRKRKLRSWLTMLGIFISVATIFLLISLSVGLQQAITEQFQLLGSDKFFIMPKGQAGAPGATGSAVELTTNDVDVIKKVNGVKDVTYITAANARVEFDKQIKYYMVAGVPLDSVAVYEETGAFKADEGRLLKQGDKRKLMIGSYYKYNNVFDKPVRAGDKLFLNGIEFKVEGILTSIGNPSDDQNIIMYIEDMKEVFNTGDRVDQIVVQIKQGED